MLQSIGMDARRGEAGITPRTAPLLVVTLLSQKGGTGKTTLALHLAGAACASGFPSAVLDLDPQGSASLWSDLRAVAAPDVAAAAPAELDGALRTAAADGLGVVFIDTAPHSEGAALSAARAADLVVVPCGISVLDVHAAAHTIELAAQARDVVAVLSQVPPRGQLKHEVREELCRCGLCVLDCEVGHRMAYRYALQDGRLVQDFAPRSKAAFEIEALWREIRFQLGVTVISGAGRKE